MSRIVFGRAGRGRRILVALLTLLAASALPDAAPAPTTRAALAAPAVPAAREASAVKPVGQTAAVPNDPDDPAIWVHPSDPSRSLLLGTDKKERVGGLYVFGVDGALRQTIAPLDRPNNVDVEYGFSAGAADGARAADGGAVTPDAVRRDAIDIAVVTERKQHRLRLFAIAPDGTGLTDLAPTGLPVLEGQTGEAAEPMGVALYKRPRDATVFAIVAPKTGGESDYLWQYRLERTRSGQSPSTVTARFVRRFGSFSRKGAGPGQTGEIEAVVVDDELGYVYYSDERYAIRKYHADPDRADAARELATIGSTGYMGDREGIAIYATGTGTGYLVSSDQVVRGTRVRLYRREGAPGNPHDHSEVWTVPTVSDETDGLDVTASPLPGFPRGLLVMMNSRARNFLLYDWRTITPDRAR